MRSSIIRMPPASCLSTRLEVHKTKGLCQFFAKHVHSWHLVSVSDYFHSGCLRIVDVARSEIVRLRMLDRRRRGLLARFFPMEAEPGTGAMKRSIGDPIGNSGDWFRTC